MCCSCACYHEIREFSPPRGLELEDEGRDRAVGCLHVCPICVRKLQLVCGFDLHKRYVRLEEVYQGLGLVDQQQWCKAVLRIGAGAGEADAGP